MHRQPKLTERWAILLFVQLVKCILYLACNGSKFNFVTVLRERNKPITLFLSSRRIDTYLLYIKPGFCYKGKLWSILSMWETLQNIIFFRNSYKCDKLNLIHVYKWVKRYKKNAFPLYWNKFLGIIKNNLKDKREFVRIRSFGHLNQYVVR